MGQAPVHWPEHLSLLLGRHATPAQMDAARAHYVGKLRYHGVQGYATRMPYRCVGVRIDQAKRLLADYVRLEDGMPG